jgi:signal transduction histidine kinase
MHIFAQKNRLFIGYTALMAVLSAVYYVTESMHIANSHIITWNLIGLIGTLAIVVGIIHNKPKAKFGWWALAVATLCFSVGDFGYDLSTLLINQQNAPVPPIIDYIYMACYPIFALSLYSLIKKRSSQKSDRGAVLDSLTLALGLALIIWVLLVIPNANVEGPLLTKFVSVFYPLADIGILFLALRLLTIDVSTRSIQFLAIGLSGLLVSDIYYGLAQFYSTWTLGGPVDLGWIIMYAFLGMAALSPSMVALDKPVTKPLPVHPRRLILLAIAALIAPTMLLVETLQGRAQEVGLVVAIFSALLFMFVILRIYNLIKDISAHDAEMTLEKQRTELIYLASHQLRTPASIVKSDLSLLLDGYLGKLTAKQIDNIKGALEENNNELDIIDGILGVISLDSNNADSTREDANLTEIVNSVIAEKQAVKTVKDRVITVNSLGDTTCSLDEEKIRIVINNLISNSVKYTHDKGVIEVLIKGTDDKVTLSVKDDGIGIPQKDLPRLFQRFMRGSNAETISMSGVGLGLYIAKSIVDDHRGNISLESKLGQGTTAVVVLPRKATL